MIFNVRVRIVDPHGRAVHETQEYTAETGLAAMHAAQADVKNTSRGLVSTTGADPVGMEEKPAPAETKPKAPRKPRKPRAKKPKKALKDFDGDAPVTEVEAELSD